MPPPALRSAGIGSAGIGHVFLDDPRIAVAQHHGATRAAHELGRALDHAVTLALGLNFYLARAGHLEALLGAALGLQLGHFAPPLAATRLGRASHGRGSTPAAAKPSSALPRGDFGPLS